MGNINTRCVKLMNSLRHLTLPYVFVLLCVQAAVRIRELLKREYMICWRQKVIV